MFKNISYVSLSFLYVNLLGYFFHFFVSRKLSPAGYGEFMVLYSLMLTVGNFANIFTNISVKTIVDNLEKKNDILRYLRKLSLIIGITFTISGIVFSGLMKNYLRISNEYYIYIVALTWGIMFLVSVERGYLQANEKFNITAFSTGIEHSIRLIFTILLLCADFYIFGALVPSVISLIIVFLFLFLINKNYKGSLKKISLKYIFKIAAYTSPTGFFVYIDDIFIKRIFSPEVAGYYASSSILGKAFIWFSLTVFSVFFPKLVYISKKNRQFKQLCMKAILFIFFLFILGEILILLFGKKIFLMLFGIKFLSGFKILPFYFVAALSLTISNIFIGINTAKEKNLFLIYIHLFVYLAGFIFIKFSNVFSYISYILILNTFFILIYSYFIFVKNEKSGVTL